MYLSLFIIGKNILLLMIISKGKSMNNVKTGLIYSHLEFRLKTTKLEKGAVAKFMIAMYNLTLTNELM